MEAQGGNGGNGGDPVTGEYDSGPVSIKWSISGTNYSKCKIDVLFNTDLMAENTLSPDNVNWDTGQHQASDGSLDASFSMQVPTAGQEGQLTLQKLVWEQSGGGSEEVDNRLLATWSQTGQS